MLYNQKEPKTTTTFSKMYLLILFCFQIIELALYLILFQYISQHNKEMAQANIISNDLLNSRKRLNFFSLSAQMLGFLTEAVYFIISLITRVIERRYMIPNIREYTNVGVFVLFSTNSTVLILASSDLRKKLFALFKR